MQKEKNYNYTERIAEEYERVLDENYYTERDYQNAVSELKESRGRSNYPSKLKKVYEILDSMNISFERGKDTGYYLSLAKENRMPVFEDVINRMITNLIGLCEKTPAPENYMERLVERLSFGEWRDDNLRVRILKRFIKYGGYLRDAGYKSESYIKKYIKARTGKNPDLDDVITNLDDGVFDEFDKEKYEINKLREKKDDKSAENSDELKKAYKKACEKLKDKTNYNRTWGLLNLADNLAKGWFKGSGGTKKELYWFAVVYNMTYKSDNAADIEEALFRDYYSNNLMRFATEAYSAFSEDGLCLPSGQGINYKNFAEMVFLYYLHNNEYSCEQKIKKIWDMIGELEDTSEGSSKKEIIPENRTMIYRELWNSADTVKIMNYSEDDFRDFIKKTYDCRKSPSGYFTKEPEQKSAFSEYEKLYNDLRNNIKKELRISRDDKAAMLRFSDDISKNGKEIQEIDQRITELSNGAPLNPSEYYNERGFIDFKKSRFEKDPNFETFIKVVTKFKGYLKSLKDPKDVDSAQITRTLLLAVYYFNFCIEKQLYSEEHDCNDKTKQIIKDFRRGADEILEKAYYQTINSKNLFDVLLIFSAYANCSGIN